MVPASPRPRHGRQGDSARRAGVARRGSRRFCRAARFLLTKSERAILPEQRAYNKHVSRRQPAPSFIRTEETIA
jgi:hypothetical protein